MPSTLSWLDHDPAAHEQSLRILAMFEEKDTRDELGIGGIRDSLSDQLFPGTSTIQTRLRYMLFVPWVYRQLEEKRVPGSEFWGRLRHSELSLVTPLLAGDNRAGLFGRMAGKGLKRLPSSVYWAGLGSWGIRLFRGSQYQYHRTIDSIYQRRGRLQPRDDGEREVDSLAVTWHPRIPNPPEGYPERLSFALTQEEAHFLLDRVVASSPSSLLAHLFQHCEPFETAYPWEHPQQGGFQPHQGELLDHARRFAELVHGAHILYNLHLGERAGREEVCADRRRDWNEWFDRLPVAGLGDWALARFWELTLDHGHTISRPTRWFVEAWLELVRNGGRELADNTEARHLIEQRERRLKGPRSRFANQRARDQWGGRAGMGLLEYRWPTIQSFHQDLYNGLHPS